MNTLALDPIAIAYHELCSPLALVATAARALLDEDGSDFARSRCAAIERTAERLLRTARYILQVASGGDLPEPAKFSPASLVEEVVADFRALDLNVCLEIDAGLHSAMVVMPRTTFEILLQSLLSNARDHGAPGLPVSVTVSRDDAGRMTITMSNHVAPARTHEGLGVGTYFSRRLAVLLEVDLDSHTDGDRYETVIVLRGRTAGSRAGAPALGVPRQLVASR